MLGKTFPQSGIKIKKWLPQPLSISDHVSQDIENIFTISRQCLISQQTRSFDLEYDTKV